MTDPVTALPERIRGLTGTVSIDYKHRHNLERVNRRLADLKAPTDFFGAAERLILITLYQAGSKANIPSPTNYPREYFFTSGDLYQVFIGRISPTKSRAEQRQYDEVMTGVVPETPAAMAEQWERAFAAVWIKLVSELPN